MSIRSSADGQNYTQALSLGSQTNFTFACWARISVDRNTYSTFSELRAATPGMHFGPQADGTSLGLYDDNAGTTVANGPNLVVGTWYFAGYSVTGTTGLLYVRAADGTVTTDTWVSAPRTLTTLVLNSNQYGEWYNGNLAAVKLWTAGFTEAAFERESRQYLPSRTADSQLFCPFLKPETTDYSGNGRTLAGGTGITGEDGPPIPWSGSRPRLILPVSTGGTALTLTDTPTAVTAGHPPGGLALDVVFTDDPRHVTTAPQPDTLGLGTGLADQSGTAARLSGDRETFAAVTALTDAPGAPTTGAPAETLTLAAGDELALADAPAAAILNGPSESIGLALIHPDAPRAVRPTGPADSYAAAAVLGDQPTALRTAKPVETLTLGTGDELALTDTPRAARISGVDGGYTAELVAPDGPAAVRLAGPGGSLTLAGTLLLLDTPRAGRLAGPAATLTLAGPFVLADQPSAVRLAGTADTLSSGPAYAWPIRPGVVSVEYAATGTMSVERAATGIVTVE